MMEGKATVEEQAARSALGGRTKSIRRKLRRGRADESGLTTLEWLLIVAAVAGLAALAVVLVQNVVDQTAEEISGSSARRTAAQVAADAVELESKSARAFNNPRIENWSDWELYYSDKCGRIGVTYSDAKVTMDLAFNQSGDTFGTTELATATDAVTTGAAGTLPQAKCDIN